MKAAALLRERWAALGARERRLVGVAAALLGLVLAWWVALAPALRTIAAAPAEHAKLDAQLQQMSTLQAQAKALQGRPRANPGDAMKALEGSVRSSLGAAAQLQPQGTGEGVRVTVAGVPADALAQWLAQARGNAHAVPREVHLTRGAAAAGAPAGTPANRPRAPATAPADASTARWDGTLVMSLPPTR